MKRLIIPGLFVGLGAAAVGTAILASAASMLGVGGGAPGASSAATATIPPAMLTLYQQAAATCPGLPWTIPAAIGTVESDNGQSNLPGVHSGANAAGAEGPMQFLPANFSLGSMSRRRLTCGFGRSGSGPGSCHGAAGNSPCWDKCGKSQSAKS
jgi:hypothetical protein